MVRGDFSSISPKNPIFIEGGLDLPKKMNILPVRRLASFSLLLFVSLSLSGCYIFNFFNKDDSSSSSSATFSGTVAGQPLGSRAGGVNSAALALVHAEETEYAPAAIRPDPDTYIRQLLRQYRAPGATIARQIGNIASYRLLLGGATEDFNKQPQDSYDATSLLTTFAVAQEVCIGLVSPNAWNHEGWETILPYSASDEDGNIRWLAQRFIGKKTSDIDEEKITSLKAILAAEESYVNYSSGNYDKYIPVCAALAMDAEALFL